VLYPPTGSTAYEREMSNPPTRFLEYGLPLSLPLTKYSEKNRDDAKYKKK